MLPAVFQTPRLRSAAAPFAANGVLYGTWAARLPEVQTRTGLSEGDLGLALLGAAAGLVVSASATGPLVERFGAHQVTRIALALFAVLVVAPGLATGFASLTVALVLVGLSSGLLDVSMNAWAAEVEATSGRIILGACHGLFSFGMMIGAGLGALAEHNDVSLALHFGASGVVFAGAAILQSLGIPNSHEARDLDSASPLFAFPSGPVAGLAVLALFGLIVEGAMADWSAIFLRDVLAASEAMAALSVAVFAGCMAVARFGADALTARIGDTRLVRAGALLGLVGLVTCIVAPVATVAVAGFGLVGLGFAAVIPALFRAASKAPGQASGSGIAAVASLGYLGLLGGPPVIGFLADIFGLRVSFGVLVGLAGLVALGAGTAFRRARPAAAEASPSRRSVG